MPASMGGMNSRGIEPPIILSMNRKRCSLSNFHFPGVPPVMDFARHALVDTEVAGTPIKAGEKVGLFYCSANRDEAVFDRPHEFDITRSPNPHFGFGGGGAHFCLGAQLAKMQLRQLFGQLLTRLPAIQLGEPEYLHSNVFHGIKHMSISLA